MNICPITYEDCEEGRYSQKGLGLLSRRLSKLDDFPYSAEEQVREAALRATKMSIQGVQPKLSVSLNIKKAFLKWSIRVVNLSSSPRLPTMPNFPKTKI